MKSISLIILLVIVFSISSSFSQVRSQDSENSDFSQTGAEDAQKKIESILHNTAMTILENKSAKEKGGGDESGKITFKVKKANLWLKEKNTDKKSPDQFVETTLSGKLYFPPKEVLTIEKKDIDRSTLEDAVASVFSANRAGEIDWIAENFVDKDKETIKKLFVNKKLLEESRADAEKIVSIYLTGQATYKGSVLAFIEQNYIDGRKIREALAYRKTEKGWKVTNEFSSDGTFDIVFGALSSGEVSIKGNDLKKETPIEKSKS